MALTIPNWPVLLTEWGAPYGSNGGSPASQNVDISNRVVTTMGAKTGKQYELDQAQAGELTVTLRNDDAVLDPTNASSPFVGHIAPYQPLRVRAMYPPTNNLLTSAQAQGGVGTAVGAIPSSFNIFAGTDPNGTGSIVADATTPNNTAFSFVVPTSFGAGQFICAFDGCSCEPNASYTFSTNLMNVTSGVSGPVKLAFGWYGPNFSFGPASWSYGPVVNLTFNTWFSVSATATAPSWACGLAVGIVTGGTPSAQWTMEAYNSQFERGSSATTYTVPGTVYPVFSGHIERWPSKWRDGGQYGTIGATVVDAMALLSQGQLSDPLTEEIQNNSSRFLYRLDDPSSSSQAYEAKGRFSQLSIQSSSPGAGTVTFGNAITATNPTTGVFTAGATSPQCVQITPGTFGTSFLDLDAVGITGPAGTSFTRMIAFRWTGTVTAASQAVYLWAAGDVSGVNQVSLILLSSGSSNSAGGQLGFYIGATGLLYTPTGGVNPFDGNWHLVMLGYDGTSSLLSIDGQYSSSVFATTVPSCVNDQLGYLGTGNVTTYSLLNMNGNLAYAAEFPSMLSSTAVSNIYSAWKNACQGESTTNRYKRILRYGGFTGPTNIGSGVLTTSMGPASDLDGSDVLSALESVVVTENGNHWIGADGTLNFTGRAARYNRPTPTYILGENAAGGEWPYEDLQLDYDTTHLANDVTVTQSSTSQNFYAMSSASQTAYFDRTMTRTINSNSQQECQDAASFLAWRYSQPITRVSSVTINPAALSGLWPVALSIDIGMCIQINRRPPGCPEISLLVWVENKQWTLDEKGNAKLVLQCSPAITTNMGQFSIWSAQLASQAIAGTNTITINAATDMVNPLNAYFVKGQTFQIHTNGTAAFENLTIQSVQATGSNWTSGTITFTTNLTITHPAGTACGEQSFGTALTAYEPNSIFDSVAFAY